MRANIRFAKEPSIITRSNSDIGLYAQYPFYSSTILTIPAGTTKKLKVTASWDFAFMIVPVAGSSAGCFGVWYFVAGYATGSRARVQSINNGMAYYLAMENAPDYESDKTFNLRNGGDSNINIKVIPFVNDNKFSLV